MLNESQLRAANNDGMDPYWKPEPPKESDYILLQRAIINHFEEYANALKEHKDLNFETHKINMPLTSHNKQRIEFILRGLLLLKGEK
jgi:hypothetical protein